MRPLSTQLVAVRAGGRGDVVGVGAGVGLGDRERHRAGAVADAGQPALLLLLGPVAADDRAADRRADDHQQQRAALGGELLAHRRDVADAAAPAAVLLGDVDAEVAVLADLQPQLGGLLAGARLLGEPLAAVLRGQPRHRLAQLLALLGLGEPMVMRLLLSTTARTSPAATCAPAFTSIWVTDAGGAARSRCAASSSPRGRGPAARPRPAGPASTATLTTVPGIGASRLPLATASAGSTNRGTRVSRDVAARAVDVDGVAATATSYVVRTPSASRRDARSGSRRRPREAVDGVAVAAAEPLDGRPPRTRCAAAARPRCARRPGCPAGRCGPPGPLGKRERRGHRGGPVVEARASAPRNHRRGSRCSPRRRRNARVAEDRTSRSRLVTSPWIRARDRAPASLRAACLAGRCVGDHLGEHRVVVGRDLAAGLEAGVRRGSPALAGDLEARSASRSAAGSRRPGPRRRAAPRSRARAAQVERSEPRRDRPRPPRSAARPGRRRGPAR